MANEKVIKNIAKGATIFAVVGVTGLAIAYRKEIIGKITGKRIVSKKAVQVAKKELTKWENGSIKEHDSRTLEDLKDYWRAVNLDYSKMKTEPWSAAFISWVMKQAGAKDQFDYSASHSVYIRRAIENKKANKGSWKGYKPSEVKVEKGDLICYARPISDKYDATGRYASHCDIVHDVDRKSKVVRAIGGNVSNSVTESTARIDSNGKLEGNKYFVVLKNK